MTATLVLVVGLVIVAAVFGDPDQREMVHAATGQEDWDGPALGFGQEIALAGIGFVHLGFCLALLVLARAVFARLAQGDPAAAARRAQWLARVFWALFGWSIVAGAIGSVVLTWHLPEGERTLAVGLGTSQFSLALAALIAGFLAQAFSLGAALWRDHQEIV